jgi:hypothetical protein
MPIFTRPSLQQKIPFLATEVPTAKPDSETPRRDADESGTASAAKRSAARE